MNSNSLVSIIVPVYNTEQYLERCVSSLTKQTYKNIEIILVDDGSTDNSFELLKRIELTDDRIRVLYSGMYLDERTNQNHGLETTRNCGLKFATGEYVMFLDSDDTFHENAVMKMLAFAIDNDTDIAIAPFNEIIGETLTLCKANIEEGVYSKNEIAKHCFVDVSNKVLSCIGNKIYKRAWIEEHSLRFNNYYRYNEDASFVISSLSYAEKIGYTNFPFYNYIIRKNGSIQTTYRENMFELIMRTYKYYKYFFTQTEAFDYVKTEYYKLIDNVALNSLFNEATYTNYEQFKITYLKIRESEYYKGMQESFHYASLGQKIMLVCMKMDTPKLLYRIMRAKKDRK